MQFPSSVVRTIDNVTRNEKRKETLGRPVHAAFAFPRTRTLQLLRVAFPFSLFAILGVLLARVRSGPVSGGLRTVPLAGGLGLPWRMHPTLLKLKHQT